MTRVAGGWHQPAPGPRQVVCRQLRNQLLAPGWRVPLQKLLRSIINGFFAHKTFVYFSNQLAPRVVWSHALSRQLFPWPRARIVHCNACVRACERACLIDPPLPRRNPVTAVLYLHHSHDYAWLWCDDSDVVPTKPWPEAGHAIARCRQWSSSRLFASLEFRSRS